MVDIADEDACGSVGDAKVAGLESGEFAGEPTCGADRVSDDS